jgi:hypothetical protein
MGSEIEPGVMRAQKRESQCTEKKFFLILKDTYLNQKIILVLNEISLLE